jgi:multisubunit Na+/H+ antiporter MnhB subunit
MLTTLKTYTELYAHGLELTKSHGAVIGSMQVGHRIGTIVANLHNLSETWYAVKRDLVSLTTTFVDKYWCTMASLTSWTFTGIEWVFAQDNAKSIQDDLNAVSVTLAVLLVLDTNVDTMDQSFLKTFTRAKVCVTLKA